jgi:hypothetical protein
MDLKYSIGQEIPLKCYMVNTENIYSALSKLESQIIRNKDLPDCYRTILKNAYKELREIEYILKTKADKEKIKSLREKT